MSQSGTILATYNHENMSIKIIQYMDKTIIALWENKAVIILDSTTVYAILKRIRQMSSSENQTGLTAEGMRLLEMLDEFL